jgi:glycosyltransferase involved in cell wall biosynthesis
VLDEPALAAELGRSGRALAAERYSWRGAAHALEAFFRRLLARRSDPLVAAGAHEARFQH